MTKRPFEKEACSCLSGKLLCSFSCCVGVEEVGVGFLFSSGIADAEYCSFIACWFSLKNSASWFMAIERSPLMHIDSPFTLKYHLPVIPNSPSHPLVDLDSSLSVFGPNYCVVIITSSSRMFTFE